MIKRLLFLIAFLPSLSFASVIINPGQGGSSGGSSIYPSTSTPIFPSVDISTALNPGYGTLFSNQTSFVGHNLIQYEKFQTTGDQYYFVASTVTPSFSSGQPLAYPGFHNILSYNSADYIFYGAGPTLLAYWHFDPSAMSFSVPEMTLNSTVILPNATYSTSDSGHERNMLDMSTAGYFKLAAGNGTDLGANSFLSCNGGTGSDDTIEQIGATAGGHCTMRTDDNTGQMDWISGDSKRPRVLQYANMGMDHIFVPGPTPAFGKTYKTDPVQIFIDSKRDVIDGSTVTNGHDLIISAEGNSNTGTGNPGGDLYLNGGFGKSTTGYVLISTLPRSGTIIGSLTGSTFTVISSSIALNGVTWVSSATAHALNVDSTLKLPASATSYFGQNEIRTFGALGDKLRILSPTELDLCPVGFGFDSCEVFIKDNVSFNAFNAVDMTDGGMAIGWDKGYLIPTRSLSIEHKLGVGTAEMRGQLDVVSSTETIPDVVWAAASQENGAYHYLDNGNFFDWQMWAYRTINGERVYSENPFDFTNGDSGSSSVNFRWALSWTAVPGAEGYLIEVLENDYDGIGTFTNSIIRYKDVGNVTSYNDNGGQSAFPSTGPFNTPDALTADWYVSDNGYLYSNQRNLKFGVSKMGTPGGNETPTAVLSNSQRQVIIEANTDSYAGASGGVSLTLVNEDFHNGALFRNKSLDLIDFQFAGPSTVFNGNNLFSTIRWEGRSAYVRDPRNRARGELQLGSTVDGDGIPSVTIGESAMTVKRSSVAICNMMQNNYVYTITGGTLTTSTAALFDGITSTFTNVMISSYTAKTLSTVVNVTTTSNNLPITSGGIFRATAPVAATITGFASAGYQSGYTFTLLNVGTNTITFSQESASSSAANRIWTNTGSNTTVAAGLQFGASADFLYDGNRWRQLR